MFNRHHYSHASIKMLSVCPTCPPKMSVLLLFAFFSQIILVEVRIWKNLEVYVAWKSHWPYVSVKKKKWPRAKLHRMKCKFFPDAITAYRMHLSFSLLLSLSSPPCHSHVPIGVSCRQRHWKPQASVIFLILFLLPATPYFVFAQLVFYTQLLQEVGPDNLLPRNPSWDSYSIQRVPFSHNFAYYMRVMNLLVLPAFIVF